ncbi:MAG TPA: RHS repeat-associated core domain-containing protein [Terriglobia bacterium]|nr:RHS repeat-associated core domain-containing protein [Terriglobia bacterium]
MRGYLYQDSVNSSLGHAATYSYDSLNRLANAAATGSSTYNFTFQYDRWGNMTCMINGQTNGPCPEYSFNSANNQVTNTGYTYDAAGDLTSDLTTVPSSAYQWDAEGHLATITQGGSAYSTSAYNANGQMVETVYPAFGNAKIEALLDPFGRELGYYDGQMNAWFDRDFWVAGRMFAQSYPNEMYFLHHNVLGSDVQLTGHSGTPTVDILYYPWGGENTHIGYESDSHFAGFEQTGGNLNPTPTRRYANPMGRWLTPDMLGGDITNPQSLNRYAYALNNPTTLTDPLGLTACNEFNTSYEGSGLPFPCNNCPSSGACGTSNNPSGPAPVTIDSNGDPLSSDIAAGEAAYVSNNCLNCVSVEGNFYGQHVNTTFSSWDAYANWSTSLPLLPQNQIYDAFWALLENNGLDQSQQFGVFAYQQGPTWNVQLLGYPLNTSNAAQGRIPDPYHGVHAGNSWYGLSPVNTLHLVDDPKGAEVHFDLFNGVLMFPLHETFDYFPSLFINPKSQVPQPTVNWYCSGSGGCHQ